MIPALGVGISSPTSQTHPTAASELRKCGKLRVCAEVEERTEIGLEQMDEDVQRVFLCKNELDEFNTPEMRFGL